MEPSSEILVIQTDEDGAVELEKVAKEHEEIRCQKRKIQAQVGDPNVWMFIAELATSALPILSTAILMLVRQRKIKLIKIGEEEFHNITPEQFERVMHARKGDKPHG